MNVLLDLVFPRICLSCKEGIADRLFCPACWDLLSPPDPVERCRHCFEPFEGDICKKCNQNPELCFPRAKLFDSTPPARILRGKMGEMPDALAGFALIFWHRLGFELPDLLIPIPDQKGSKAVLKIARLFAKLLDRPCVAALQKRYTAFLQPEISLSKHQIKEDQTVLLFDGASSLDWLKNACEKTAEIFPKQAMVLSLF